MSLDQFREQVESFIAQNRLTPTAFGKRYAADPLFVFQLRKGREPREATRDKILSAITDKTERVA